jgi:iron complex transport system ATP-binding protein
MRDLLPAVTEESGLTTENLSVGYGAGAVLFEGLSLRLRRGRLTCFMGPNGIGKSTLIKTLAGLQAPVSGRSTRLSEKELALVLTDKIVAAHMRVRDLVSYGRYPHTGWSLDMTQRDNEVIESSMADANVLHLAERNINELSDGQLQMVLIARALAQETEVLFLDEPTAHLDLNNRMEIMSLLRKMAHEKNKSVLVATHELDLALQMADEVWLAMPGKKIKTGVPEDLVLDGSFDEVFQLKGFDLKTGKVKHTAFRGMKIKIVGEGPEFLWTKNALEREGFLIDDAGLPVIVMPDEKACRWKLGDEVYSSLGELLNRLKKA